MTKKVIELKIDTWGDYSCRKLDIDLCGEGVRKIYHIPASTETIYVTLSNKMIKGGYEIKIIDEVFLELKGSGIQEYLCFSERCFIAKYFPEGCYVKLEY